MAVAVNDQRETSTSGSLDRVPVVSLIGVVYVVSSLIIVFKLIPLLWSQVWGGLGYNTASFASYTLQGMLMLAAAAGLFVVGNRLLGPRPLVGVKAGIFTALVGLLLILLLTRWFSLWVEHFTYDEGVFGSAGKTVGAVLVGLFGLALAAGGIWLFFQPAAERRLAGFEEQGWFSTTSYKKNQGSRVRRGTILGVLLLLGSGVWTMVSHQTLRRGPENWELTIPFTGVVTLKKDNLGDAEPEIQKLYPSWFKEGAPATLDVDRYALRDINAHYDSARYVKIEKVLEPLTQFEDGQIVEKGVYEKEKRELDQQRAVADPEKTHYGVAPTPAWGATSFASLTLLPHLQFTLPIALLALSIWIAWRIVNYPTFADFLIATEAELNKVSWTTRKRLFQDTVVVLVTVVLMVFYLFAMDAMWGAILSWRPIGVIVAKDADSTKDPTLKPW